MHWFPHVSIMFEKLTKLSRQKETTLAPLAVGGIYLRVCVLMESDARSCPYPIFESRVLLWGFGGVIRAKSSPVGNTPDLLRSSDLICFGAPTKLKKVIDGCKRFVLIIKLGIMLMSLMWP